MAALVEDAFVIDKGHLEEGNTYLVPTINSTDELSVMRKLLNHSVGLQPDAEIDRAQLLHLFTNNDVANLDLICSYMDHERKRGILERAWDDSVLRHFIDNTYGEVKRLSVVKPATAEPVVKPPAEQPAALHPAV